MSRAGSSSCPTAAPDDVAGAYAVDWEDGVGTGGGHLVLDVDMTFGEVLIRRG